MKVELRFLFSAHFLMMLYICTKFYENTDTIFLRKKLKVHNSSNTLGGVMALFLCTPSDGG